MRFYESHFEEYVCAADAFDLRPEFAAQRAALPARLADLPDLVVYGPAGAGKYTETLRILAAYSPSALRGEHRITAITERQSYTYRASDVHFEVDMSLLGCNSRLLWNEVFSQIADIVAVRADKCAAIVCLNFHAIHQELLDIFYSYMQRGLSSSAGRVVFVLVSESVGFIPDRVLSRCRVLALARPGGAAAAEMRAANARLLPAEDRGAAPPGDAAPGGHTNLKCAAEGASACIMDAVCANIVGEMLRGPATDLLAFRDTIYDIPVYGLDASECVWTVMGALAARGEMCSAAGVGALMARLARFFRRRNNNYREIFHLEGVFFAIMCEARAARGLAAAPPQEK